MPGPIITDVVVLEGLGHNAIMSRHGVWVPAFAGTTIEKQGSAKDLRIPGDAI
jgi:hypothetical protein